MGYSVILLLLPTLVCASIRVHIKASANKDQVSATFNGTDDKIITIAEITSFDLSDSNLKAAILANEGATPTDVYLTSFTPWGDLYKSYNWPEVKRHTKVKKIEIVAVDTETVTLVEQICENKLTNGTAVFSADVSDGLAIFRSVKKSYKGMQLSADAEYDVDFDIGMSPPMHMKFLANLRAAHQLAKIGQKVQAESEVKFALKPSQSAKLVLNATKVTIDLSVDYETSLNGSVATNFYPKYKGHHFWAYDIRDVMNATDVSPFQKSNDSVSITYYTDLCVYVTDQKTSETIISVPYDYVPEEKGQTWYD